MRAKLTRFSTLFFIVCFAFGQSDADQREAKGHYRIALEALHDDNVSVASEELTKAVGLAPDNALVRYYLGLVQSKHNEAARPQRVLPQVASLKSNRNVAASSVWS